MSKIAVVLGYGALVGHGVAQAFGGAGFRLVLVSRTKAKLDAAVEAFAAKGIQAFAYATDFFNTEETLATLKRIVAEIGVPEVFVYNGKPRDGAATPLAITPADLTAFLHATIVTLITSVQYIVAEQKKAGAGGTIILTGGGFGLDGRYTVPYGTQLFGATNAFWHNLGESYYATLKPDNIHAGVIIIRGMVQDGDATHSPEKVGAKYLEFHQQAPDAWTEKILY